MPGASGRRADILDLGAESSRPVPVPTASRRNWLACCPCSGCDGLGIPVSVDTSKPEVMKAAWLGAVMINDITALANPDALAVVSASDCGICLVMHMQGTAYHTQPVRSMATWFAGGGLSRQSGRSLPGSGDCGARVVVDPGFRFQDPGAQSCPHASAGSPGTSWNPGPGGNIPQVHA